VVFGLHDCRPAFSCPVAFARLLRSCAEDASPPRRITLHAAGISGGAGQRGTPIDGLRREGWKPKAETESRLPGAQGSVHESPILSVQRKGRANSAPGVAEHIAIALAAVWCGIPVMDTTRVDICYRPLRITWAIHSSDKDAFRRAIRLTHTLRGGRFNPIVFADRADEARKIIDLYRADMIVPIGDSAEVTNFPTLLPNLAKPFFGEGLFVRDGRERARARLLDIHNALVHWQGTPEWQAIEEPGLRSFVCGTDDPLADVVLV
jgi:hypothetical protein